MMNLSPPIIFSALISAFNVFYPTNKKSCNTSENEENSSLIDAVLDIMDLNDVSNTSARDSRTGRGSARKLMANRRGPRASEVSESLASALRF